MLQEYQHRHFVPLVLWGQVNQPVQMARQAQFHLFVLWVLGYQEFQLGQLDQPLQVVLPHPEHQGCLVFLRVQGHQWILDFLQDPVVQHFLPDLVGHWFLDFQEFPMHRLVRAVH
jgi:hypothetical protein